MKYPHWRSELDCTISQRHGPGRKATHLEVHTMWVQQMSKQYLLKVHKVPSEEHEADVPTKHVPEQFGTSVDHCDTAT